MLRSGSSPLGGWSRQLKKVYLESGVCGFWSWSCWRWISFSVSVPFVRWPEKALVWKVQAENPRLILAIVLSCFFQGEIYGAPEPDSLKMHRGDNRKHCIPSNITTFYYKICIFWNAPDMNLWKCIRNNYVDAFASLYVWAWVQLVAQINQAQN